MAKHQSSVARVLPHYTYNDYRRWEGDWELIEGIPYAMAPSPVSAHQYAVTELVYQIRRQIENCPRDCYVFSELDWIVSDDIVLRPDVVVLCQRVEDYIKSPPEVVFEVVSKHSLQKDEYIKFEIYEREKVSWYVLVYPDIKKARLFRLKDGRFDKASDCTEDKFSIALSACEFEIDFSKLWYK
jgi:Uma2 family endonuclease